VALHLASGVTPEENFKGRVRANPQLAERPPVVDWVQLRGGLARAKAAGGPTEILREIGSLALAALWGGEWFCPSGNRSSTVADAELARTKAVHLQGLGASEHAWVSVCA
jgi:hypothetical protein